MSCISHEINAFLKLSVMVPIFSSIGTFLTDILIPSIENHILKKKPIKQLKYDNFIIRLLIAIFWPAFLCVVFGYSVKY